MKKLFDKKLIMIGDFPFQISGEYELGAVTDTTAQVRYKVTLHEVSRIKQNKYTVMIKFKINEKDELTMPLFYDTVKTIYSSVSFIYPSERKFFTVELDKNKEINTKVDIYHNFFSDLTTISASVKAIPKMNLRTMSMGINTTSGNYIPQPYPPTIYHKYAEQNIRYIFDDGSFSHNSPNSYTFNVYQSTNYDNPSFSLVSTREFPASQNASSFTFNIAGWGREYFYRAAVKGNYTGQTTSFSLYSDWCYRLPAVEAYIATPSSNNTRVSASTSVRMTKPTKSAHDFEGRYMYSYKIYGGSNFMSLYESGSYQTDYSSSGDYYSLGNILINYVGAEVEIRGYIQTTVGFNSDFHDRRVFVGINYSAGSPYTSSSNFTPNMTLYVKPSKYDGYNISYGHETIQLEYQLEGSNTWYICETKTRGRDYSNGFGSDTYFTNFYQSIVEKIKQQFPERIKNGISTQITFRVKGTFKNGETNYSGTDYSIYTPPMYVVTMDRADDSSIMKYPMNKTTPVTKNSFRLKTNVTKWNSGDTGRLLVLLAPSSGSIITVMDKTIRNTITNDYDTINLSNYNLKTDTSYQVYTQLYLTTQTSTLLDTSDVYWENTIGLEIPSRNIELQTDFSARTELVSSTDDFIDPIRTENRSLCSYDIFWENSRAFLISSASVKITDRNNNSITTTITPNIQLFSTTEISRKYEDGKVKLKNIIGANNKWLLDSVTLLGTTKTTESYGLSTGVRGFHIVYSFTLQEAYRDSPTSTTPNFTTSYLSSHSKTISFSYEAHTVSLPLFDEKDIQIERTI